MYDTEKEKEKEKKKKTENKSVLDCTFYVASKNRGFYFWPFGRGRRTIESNLVAQSSISDNKKENPKLSSARCKLHFLIN